MFSPDTFPWGHLRASGTFAPMSQILQICSHLGSVDLDETFRKENFENTSPTSRLLVFLKFWGQSDECKGIRAQQREL